MTKGPNAKVKMKGLDIPVPRNELEADEYIYNIGECQRQRQRIEAEMNDEIAALKARYEAAARPFAERIDARAKALQAWCEANRPALTKAGRTKTRRFGSGEVSWRQRPPRVVIRGVEKVLEALRARKLKRFIRLREEIDKEAMLREPELARAVPGVAIGSDGEDFVIKPFETELEEIAR